MELATKIMKIVVLGLAVIVALGMIVVISTDSNKKPEQEVQIEVAKSVWAADSKYNSYAITMYKPTQEFIDAMNLNGQVLEEDCLVSGDMVNLWNTTLENEKFEAVVVAPKYTVVGEYIELWIPEIINMRITYYVNNELDRAKLGTVNNYYSDDITIFNGKYRHFLCPIEKVTVEVND